MRLRGHCFVSWPSSPTTLVRQIPRRGANKTGKLIRSGSGSTTGPIGTIGPRLRDSRRSGHCVAGQASQGTTATSCWHDLNVTKEVRSDPSRGTACDDYDAGVDTLVVNGQPPTPSVLVGWQLGGHVARVSCGATPTRAQRQGPPFAKAGRQLLASVPGVKVTSTSLARTDATCRILR